MLGTRRSQRPALGANTFDKAALTMKWTYEHQANTHGEATLAAKLNAHGEAAYENFANT